MTDNYTSGPNERFNKDIKAAAKFTNFSSSGLNTQVNTVTGNLLV